jgi:hypothetical protein
MSFTKLKATVLAAANANQSQMEARPHSVACIVVG